MSDLELNEVEKATAREVLIANMQAQQASKAATTEAERRSAHVEAVVNTIVRLRGLDPTKWQLAYDLNKDTWELRELAIPVPVVEEPVSIEAANGELVPEVVGSMPAPNGPTDIDPTLLNGTKSDEQTQA